MAQNNNPAAYVPPFRILASQTDEKEADFEWYGMSALLDVNSMPQQVDDTALTIAQNVYGDIDGGVQKRKGMTVHGSLLDAGAGLGGFRFFQQVVNGVVQSPAIRKSYMQVGSKMYDIDAGGAALTSGLGGAALAWSATQINDPDHTLLNNTVAPTNDAPIAGGTLAAGTYLLSVSWTTGAGQTLVGPDLTVIVTINQKVNIHQPASPPAGATGWNLFSSTVGGAHNTETVQNGVSPIPIGTTTFLFTSLVAGTALPVANTALATSDIMVICTGSGGPYAWDGTTLYVPAAWTANAAGARWCTVINGILFFGGIPAQPNLVVGMKIGQPETLPAGGIYTFAVSLPVTGLGRVGVGPQAGLVVGMQRGISVLYGASQQNLYLAEVPDADGVAAGRTMITIAGVCFFMGGTNIYAYDGSQLYPLGLSIKPWILNSGLATGTFDLPMNGDRTKAWAFYYNRRVHFVYDSGNVGHANAMVVWDLELQGWTTVVGPTVNAGFALDAPGDPYPPGFIVIDSTKGQAYNWDVYNGTGHNVDDNGTPFVVLAQSKFFKMGKSGATKKLTRVYPEMFVETLQSTQIVVESDYGTSSVASIVVGAPIGTSTWDVSKWDQAQWAAGSLLFVHQRSDFDVEAEAFAIAIYNNDASPPWSWQGATGTVVIQPKD